MDSACNSLLNVSFHKTLSQKHFNSIGLQKQLVCICHEELVDGNKDIAGSK